MQTLELRLQTLDWRFTKDCGYFDTDNHEELWAKAQEGRYDSIPSLRTLQGLISYIEKSGS